MSWPTTIASLKNLGQTVWHLLIRNDFTSKGHSDLDLWPSDNRGHLVVRTNHHKFKDSRPNRLAVIDRKWFYNWRSVTLTFDLVTSKTIGVIFVSWPTTAASLKILDQTVHQLLIRNHLIYRQTYRQTDQPIDMCEAIYPNFFQKGGIKSFYSNTSTFKYALICTQKKQHTCILQKQS